MRRFITLTLATIALSACAVRGLHDPVNPNPSAMPTPVVPSQSPVMEDTTAPTPSTGTAAIIPVTERYLSGGILEIGSTDAPVILRAFINTSSEYSKRFHTEIVPRLKKDFVETGTVRLQMVPMHLQKYPASDDAAMLLHCASQSGSGSAMLDLLFTTVTLTTKTAPQYATCVKDPVMRQSLDLDRAYAQEMGVTLVPTLLINGQKIIGLPEYADLRGMLRTAALPENLGY